MSKGFFERLRDTDVQKVIKDDFTVPSPILRSAYWGFISGLTLFLDLNGTFKRVDKFDREEHTSEQGIVFLLSIMLGLILFLFLSFSLFSLKIYVVLLLVTNTLSYLVNAVRRADDQKSNQGDDNAR